MVLGVMPFLLAIIPGPNRAGPMVAVFSSHAAVVLAWSLTYIGYHHLQDVREAETEKWRLKLLVRETELGALRHQLNPHFLFNSLNNLQGLVTEDPAAGAGGDHRSRGLLRHTLQLSRSGTTTLDRELEATSTTWSWKRCFESHCATRSTWTSGHGSTRSRRCSNQTLVENAVKHGIADCRKAAPSGSRRESPPRTSTSG
jgi:LytS/YehU family sensor histidine kinase